MLVCGDCVMQQIPTDLVNGIGARFQVAAFVSYQD